MEGEYLVLCNDLRDQYLRMKEELNDIIKARDEEIEELKVCLGLLTLRYESDRFASPRPPARSARYSTSQPPLNMISCPNCSTTICTS